MGHSNKRPTGSSTLRVVPGARPAQKRGGARSPEPAPVKRRKVSQASEGDISSPSTSRARVVKALPKPKKRVQEPLFLPAVQDEDEEHYPEDGMENDDDDEGSHASEQDDAELSGLDQDLVDFITKDIGDDDDDDDDDEEYQYGQDNDILDDDQDFSADDMDEAVEVPRASRVKPVTLTSSTPTRVRSQNSSVPHISQVVPRTPSRAGSAAAMPHPDFTPYSNPINPKDPSKPRDSQHSPATRNIVKRAKQLYRAKTVTKDAFPDDETRIELAAKFIIQAANELGASRRVARFKADPLYQDNTVKMVKRTDTQVRGEIVAAARELIGPAYGLGPGRGSAEENKTYVDLLLTKGNFLYRELETENVDERTIIVKSRAGPYRHPVVGTLIQQEFFNGHEQMATADLTTNLFNPIPLPVIAISATAVQCALRDWSSGVRVKSSSEFTSDEWATVYVGHLRELKRMLDHKPVEVDAWTRKLWRNCWSTTTQFLSGGATEASFITEGEMDDFADVLED